MKKFVTALIGLTLAGAVTLGLTACNPNKSGEGGGSGTGGGAITTVTKEEWESAIAAVDHVTDISLKYAVVMGSEGSFAVEQELDGDNERAHCIIIQGEVVTSEYYLAHIGEEYRHYVYNDEAGEWGYNVLEETTFNNVFTEWSILEDSALPFDILKTVGYDDATYEDGVYTIATNYRDTDCTVELTFKNKSAETIVISYLGEKGEYSMSFEFSKVGTTTVTLPEELDNAKPNS